MMEDDNITSPPHWYDSEQLPSQRIEMVQYFQHHLLIYRPVISNPRPTSHWQLSDKDINSTINLKTTSTSTFCVNFEQTEQTQTGQVTLTLNI